MRKEGAQGTANKYNATLIAFEKFVGSRRIHFDNVDENLLLDFEQHLRQIPLQPNTVSFYMSNFRAVYNKAQKRGYVTRGRSPFDAVPIRIEKTRKLAVSTEVIRRVAQSEFPDSYKLNCARDMFMFSFYCRGMSFVDMAYLQQEDIRDGMIHYRRRKTGQTYSVRIIPEVQSILDRYRETCSPWALPVLLEFGADGLLRPLVYNGTTTDERRLFDEKLYLRYKYSLSHYLRFSGICANAWIFRSNSLSTLRGIAGRALPANRVSRSRSSASVWGTRPKERPRSIWTNWITVRWMPRTKSSQGC